MRDFTPPAGHYSTGEVLEMVSGLTLRKIDHWRRMGAIEPAHNSRGSGDPVWWSERDVARLRAIVRTDKRICTFSRGIKLAGVAAIWTDLESKNRMTLGGLFEVEL